MFSKYLYCRHVKTRACFGKGLSFANHLFKVGNLSHTILNLMTIRKKPFENIVVIPLFSFFHNVFNKFLCHCCWKSALCCKELSDIYMNDLYQEQNSCPTHSSQTSFRHSSPTDLMSVWIQKCLGIVFVGDGYLSPKICIGELSCWGTVLIPFLCLSICLYPLSVCPSIYPSKTLSNLHLI